MKFAIPSLADLATRARAAFRAYLPGTDAWIWPNNLYVVAKVIAGSNEEIFGRLDYVAQQSRPGTATGADLDEWAAQYGMSRKTATTASGAITITAPDAMVVPAGASCTRSDGVGYLVTADQSISAAGSFDVLVVALGAGKAALAQAGTPVVFGASSLGVVPSGSGAAEATAVVAAPGIIGGSEIESDPDLQDRIKFRLSNPPGGGAPPDYVRWCTAVPGVTRVFLERLWDGPGTIRVFPIFDDTFAQTGGIADRPSIETVIAALQVVAPGGADIAVQAPTACPINIVIGNLTPLTAAIETAVMTELADTFRRLGVVAGNDTPVAALSYLATPQTFSRSWISQAIANATGEARHVLVQPATDVTIPAGAIPVLGAVTPVSI